MSPTARVDWRKSSPMFVPRHRLVRSVSLATALLGGTLASSARAQGVTANPGPLAPATSPPAAPDEPKPLRLSEKAGISWLKFGLEHRARYEYLSNDFRKETTGDSSAGSFRTSAWALAKYQPVVAGVEVLDSRVYAAGDTPVNAGLGDAFELLQAIVGLRGKSALTRGDTLAFSAGRMTLDVGSRRLVARNEFRNTINSFTGFDVQWTSPSKDYVRTFVARPVVRLPSKPDAIARNDVEFDRENSRALLWGALVETRPLAADLRVEAYAFGLLEDDSAANPTANRRLVTPGLRLQRPIATGRLDAQLELMAQFGRSRASTKPEDTKDLEHRAFSAHATVGYRFGVRTTPRLAAHYDFASGDRSSDDGIHGRFDPLFGARRFDFGPTGLYGAFARSNLHSPGIRVEVNPHPRLDAFAIYRAFWLDSATDDWTTAGLRDKAGTSGSFLGQQLEVRVRWHVLPRNLSFDVGGAGLVEGAFATSAPEARPGTPLYGYAQVTGTI